MGWEGRFLVEPNGKELKMDIPQVPVSCFEGSLCASDFPNLLGRLKDFHKGMLPPWTESLPVPIGLGGARRVKRLPPSSLFSNSDSGDGTGPTLLVLLVQLVPLFLRRSETL